MFTYLKNNYLKAVVTSVANRHNIWCIRKLYNSGVAFTKYCKSNFGPK